MGVNIFWPPLAVLAMGVMMIIVVILKYSDKLFRARLVPRYQNYELENWSSQNDTFKGDQRSIEEYEEFEEDEDEGQTQMEIIPIREKYECAV